MKFVVGACIGFLLLAAVLSSWQLIETHQDNIVLSNQVARLTDRMTELEDQKVETYYRGVYSFCMVVNAFTLARGSSELVDCDGILSGAYDQDWYERDAPGFEWPPSSD